MLSKQSLVVALHLYITLHSDAFSLRPPSIAVAPSVTRRISNVVVSPILPAHNALSNTGFSAILTNHRTEGIGPLFASSSNIIPYYDELMERLPSKKVLEAVDKSNGDPIVASGKILLFFLFVYLLKVCADPVFY